MAESHKTSAPPIPTAQVRAHEENMIDKEQLLSLERPRHHCVECNATLEELDRHPTRMRLAEATESLGAQLDA